MGHIFSLFSNHTIKTRLQLWISTIILLLTFSIIVPFYLVEKGNRLEEAGVQLKQVIALQSLYIERWNQEKLDAIKRFALSDNAKFHRIGDLKREFQDYSKINSEFYSLTFVEPDGYIRTDSTRITRSMWEIGSITNGERKRKATSPVS